MNTTSKLIGISALLFSANVFAECSHSLPAEELIDCIRADAANSAYCAEQEFFALEERHFAVMPRKTG
jgi:hypothetical protein